MSLYPFPTNVYRVFPETDIEVVKRDTRGFSTAVCVTARNTGDRAIALALLKESPTSFVLSEDVRYLPDGTSHPCDPAWPTSIAELRRAFDVEMVVVDWPGPRSRVYLYTYSQQEWEQAKSAVRHLLDQKLLSPRSYIQGKLNGEVQGLSAQNLDAKPHSADQVAMFREVAYCVQNDLYEKEEYDEDDEYNENEGEEDNPFEDEDFFADENGVETLEICDDEREDTSSDFNEEEASADVMSPDERRAAMQLPILVPCKTTLSHYPCCISPFNSLRLHAWSGPVRFLCSRKSSLSGK